MSHELFGPEWAGAYREALQKSEAYRKAASTWEWPLVLKVAADPAAGLPEEKAVYLDLWHGDCRDARVATEADLQEAPYVVSADMYTWRQVMAKKIEPINGLLLGKLKLTRGRIAELAAYVMAAKHLVEAATQVDTTFPEGLQ